MSVFAFLGTRTCIALASLCLFAGCAGERRGQSAEAGRYSHRMHNRFYEAWAQPKSVTAPRGKISVPVDVRIESDGSVRRFHLAKSSGYAAVDDSIRDVGRRITKVMPPPLASAQDHFDLRIFFELDVRH